MSKSLYSLNSRHWKLNRTRDHLVNPNLMNHLTYTNPFSSLNYELCKIFDLDVQTIEDMECISWDQLEQSEGIEDHMDYSDPTINIYPFRNYLNK